MSSDIIQFLLLTPKNPTDTTLYPRNQAQATKIFHLEYCNNLKAFCTYSSFCLKYFVHTYSQDLLPYFLRALLQSHFRRYQQGGFLSSPYIKQHPTPTLPFCPLLFSFIFLSSPYWSPPKIVIICSHQWHANFLTLLVTDVVWHLVKCLHMLNAQ